MTAALMQASDAKAGFGQRLSDICRQTGSDARPWVRLLSIVKRADRHGRFRFYTPVTLGRAPIYVHAIEALRGDGRSLVPFEPPGFGFVADDILRENDLLDPERPARQRRFFWRTCANHQRSQA